MPSVKYSTFLTLFASIFFTSASAFGAVPDLQRNTLFAAIPVNDEGVPDVTARVARISSLRGDVRIKRTDSEDWEIAPLNLPIVEGDELTTGENARIEIQFSTGSHTWVGENGYLKVTTLTDRGIVLSLPQGQLNFQLTDYSNERDFFEVDAPGTTVAALHSGLYRLDAGKPEDGRFTISVNNGGEARIYSETSGFIVKNNRSATLILTGAASGEWENGVAIGFIDEFDNWTRERQDIIAESLRKSHYDKYYDQDIYGAEDLGDFGEWVYTKNYGYVWRPYRSSIAGYSDWSPYRYGQWRWIPPYGWTWVNDEPWGWSTYHYGRWLYDAGFWYWSPYSYYRSSHSWWSPALVVFSSWGNNICWYPLPYTYSYYNYNYHYQGGHHGGYNGGNGTGPSPTPTPPIVAGGPLTTPKGPKHPPLGSVPPTGIVAVSADQFAKPVTATIKPPAAVATSILTKVLLDQPVVSILPDYTSIKMASQVRAEKPALAIREAKVRTGAMVRTGNEPLDSDLREIRILGGRTPAPVTDDPIRATGLPTENSTLRKTGAVTRVPSVRTDVQPEPVRQPPVYTPPRNDEPIRQSPPTPRYDPPPVKVPPSYSPSPQTPRYDPQPTKQPPRSDPPPTKSEPKKESKPEPPATRVNDRKKDG